jgi:type II secretory pathway pseudopilin PulG
MVMKNEKGITLVELLVAIVIAGIVIVPLLTIMTGTFTRTVSQEKETQIAYVAQEVMEKVRLEASKIESPTNYVEDSSKKKKMVYCLQKNNLIYTEKGESCIEEIPNAYKPSNYDSSDNYFITIYFNEYNSVDFPNFYEVTVTVFENMKVINGGENSTVTDKENSIELVTVVEL